VRHALHRVAVAAAALVVLAGCDGGKAPAANAANATPVAAPAPMTMSLMAAPAMAASPIPTSAKSGAPAPATLAAAPAAANPAIAAREREIVSPDDSAMVFLYYDLAGLKPPIDEWVEKDNRVQFAPGPEKAARRAAVRAEFEAGLAAVHGIGRIRLSLANAELSEYDPTYGEFTVRSLSPASMLTFQALGQKIVTRFANGQTAQLWRVPAEQAQGIRDRVGHRNVGLELLLRIVDVQPGPGGGAIVANVEEYALRAGDGSTLARVH